jgi:hypothetical protein
MGQLNIKDDKLIAEAKALAATLGTSTIGALRVAVSEARARRDAEREAKRKARFEAISAIAERAAKLLPPGTRGDHSGLYDEKGLPR